MRKMGKMVKSLNIVGLKVPIHDHLAFGDPWVEISESWGCKRKCVIGNYLLKVFFDKRMDSSCVS